MISLDLVERISKRLATIKSTNDRGHYAKAYVEDVEALLAVIHRVEDAPTNEDDEDTPTPR